MLWSHGCGKHNCEESKINKLIGKTEHSHNVISPQRNNIRITTQASNDVHKA
jgi:hypothetical protein